MWQEADTLVPVFRRHLSALIPFITWSAVVRWQHKQLPSNYTIYAYTFETDCLFSGCANIKKWWFDNKDLLKKQTPSNIWTIYRVTQNSVKTEFPTVRLQTHYIQRWLFHWIIAWLKTILYWQRLPRKRYILKRYRRCHRNMPYISLPGTQSVWFHLPLYTIHPSRTLVHQYISTGNILHLSSQDEVKWIQENFKPMLAYTRLYG